MVGLFRMDQGRHMVIILGRGGSQGVCGDRESQKTAGSTELDSARSENGRPHEPKNAGVSGPGQNCALTYPEVMKPSCNVSR